MATAQEAIDALAAKQGVPDSVTPTNLSATLQDIYDDPNEAAIVSGVNVQQVGTDIAFIASPSLNTEVSTGVDLSGYPDSDDFAIGVVFTYGGDSYGAKDRTNIGALNSLPGLRQARSVEVIGANSQVKLYYWYDDVADDLIAYVEVDGGGVSISGIRVVHYTFNLIEAI